VELYWQRRTVVLGEKTRPSGVCTMLIHTHCGKHVLFLSVNEGRAFGYHNNVLSILRRMRSVNVVLFCPVLPDAFTPRPLVLRTQVLRWRWVWNSAGMKLTGAIRRRHTGRKTCTTTNFTRTRPGLNPELRGEMPESNRLRHDTAI
jgi:hypothetical protein